MPNHFRRHAAYLQRVTAILKGSDSKVASFRSAVRTYRASEMSAKDLVHTIHSIVGHLDESAVVVNGLVDLLEEEEKRTDVLSAWNGFRIEVSVSFLPGRVAPIESC